ncbi:NAD(P)H-dependent oxidoreductase [Labilibacter sediminis]|nr:NAD(P)H-dependent oxidoreductase [Labilibacter sediminis]
MTHLIIYAHPSENSFSKMLMDELKQSTNGTNKVIVRDLYSMNFSPVLGPEELANLKLGIVASDVKEEQDYVQEADVISIVYPLWWASFPAILKGYIDRVFSYGFGYKAGEKGIEGLLKEKKVLLHTSMGNSIDDYQKNNLLQNFTFTQGEEVFGFCGMQIIKHFFYPQIINAEDEEKNHFINDTLNFYKDLFQSAVN